MTEKILSLNSEEKFSMSSSADSINKVQEEFFQHIKNGFKSGIQKLLRDNTITPWFWQDLDGNTGLLLAAMKNHVLVIKMIIKELEENYPGSYYEILRDWINTHNNNQETPIHYLSYFGNIDLIMIFEKFDVNVKQKSITGDNVLHYSSRGNQPSSLIYFFYKYRIGIDEANNHGRTPLHEAVHTSSISSVKFILRLTQEVNLKDDNGKTPLHIAVETESQSLIVRELLLNGSDREIVDYMNKTPTDLATLYEHKKLLEKPNPLFGYIQLKHSLKKQTPSLANVWAFFTIYGITFIAFILLVIPSKLHFILK